MRVTTIFEIPRDLLLNEGEAKKIARREYGKAKREHLNMSVRLISPTAEVFDQHGDCFMRNMFAVRVESLGYRVPRIAKKLVKLE